MNWQLKSIQIPGFIDIPKQCKPHKNSRGSWRNDEKINTTISTNVEGKDKKQSTAKWKQQSSPVAMLQLIRCMVGIQDCF